MYKLTNSSFIFRLADSAFLPADPANTDYQQYLLWLAAGNIPEPADPSENPRIAEIKAELTSLDFKKIRPIAAGDTEYLSILQAQTVVLQEELKALLYPMGLETTNG